MSNNYIKYNNYIKIKTMNENTQEEANEKINNFLFV